MNAGNVEREQLMLFVNWFIIARVMEVVGTLVQVRIVYNIREFGLMLGILVNVMMIWYIFRQVPVPID